MNWSSYIKNFQSYLKIERGLSKNTLDNYTFDLERLCLFLKENSIEISPIKIQEETPIFKTIKISNMNNVMQNAQYNYYLPKSYLK